MQCIRAVPLIRVVTPGRIAPVAVPSPYTGRPLYGRLSAYENGHAGQAMAETGGAEQGSGAARERKRPRRGSEEEAGTPTGKQPDRQPDFLLQTWGLYFKPDDFTMFNGEVPVIMGLIGRLPVGPSELATVAQSGVYDCPWAVYQSMGSPSQILCISCAMSERILEHCKRVVYIETRIVGAPLSSSFDGLNTENIGTMVGLLGTVNRVNFRRIDSTEGVFECSRCSRLSRTRITENIFRAPVCGCRGRAQQIFLEGHPDNRCIDRQEIKIQELYGTGKGAASVDVELSGSLVGSVAPGDVVGVVGTIGAEKVGDAYKLRIECNSIRVVRNKRGAGSEDGSAGEYNGNDSREETASIEDAAMPTGGSTGDDASAGGSGQSDFQLLRAISEEAALEELLIEAFFGGIVGHQWIKRALVLALFGGTRKSVGSGSVRSEIHILIVGDPGLGKSRLLQAASSILARSAYVSGNFCTTAGLTVSITHDPSTGEYMADAGALVVSDGGVCCIDEFDKLEDHSSLLEVMEDQAITVAKGGVVCSVPARPTIIAAANPAYGHFDPNKTLRENIKFDVALLSRFDLIFLLRDSLGEEDGYEVFRQMLRGAEGAAVPAAPKYSRAVLINYIEYARNAVQPILSRAAKDLLREYYGTIREQSQAGVRNLEALVRLTESCARAQLKSLATAVHATRAIELYRAGMAGTAGEGAGRSQRKRGIEELLREHARARGAVVSRAELVGLVERARVSTGAQEYIEMLNCKGLVIQTGKGSYRICL